MSAPFTCLSCGDTFAEDPRLAVPCPDCGAVAGQKCRRPSEHVTAMPHRRRRAIAFEANPCSCLANWQAAQRGGAGDQLQLEVP